MMPRFAGLSPVDSSMTMPWRDDDGNILNIGNTQNGADRQGWHVPPPQIPFDWHALDVNTGVTATPDAVVNPPNVEGASRPDLLVVPGASGGGGLTLGAVALLALFAVGGWFLFKRFA